VVGTAPASPGKNTRGQAPGEDCAEGRRKRAGSNSKTEPALYTRAGPREEHPRTSAEDGRGGRFNRRALGGQGVSYFRSKEIIMKKLSVIQGLIISLICAAIFLFILLNVLGLASLSYLMGFVLLFIIIPMVLLTYAIAKILPKLRRQKQSNTVEIPENEKAEPTKAAVSGSEVVDRMEELVNAPFTCPKCRKTFSIEEGFMFARKRGIRENVIMCNDCHSTYNISDVLPSVL